MVTKDQKEYRVVSFDLDGTITESREAIEPYMCDLLSELSRKALVVIISGSSYKNILVQLDLFLKGSDKEVFKNTLLMPANGSQTYFYSKATNEWGLIDITPMPFEVRRHVTDVLEKLIESGDFEVPRVGVGKQIEDRETQIAFAALGIDAPLEQKKLWDPSTEKRKKIVSSITNLLPETAIFIAGTTTIDILPKGINKGDMLEKMLEKRGLKKSDLLFIGDALYEGGNDYEVEKEGFTTIKTSGPKETAEIIKEILNK